MPKLVAQQPTLLVSLRDGSTLLASAIRGQPDGELVLRTADGERRLPAAELLGLAGVPVQNLALPRAWLAGGEQLVGAVVGGASSGDTVELMSPVLGRVVLAVDRLEALAAAGESRLQQLALPRGVDEALCRRTRGGYDWIVGSLHQVAADRLLFQPADEAAPRWFALPELVGLRLQDAQPRTAAGDTWLRTRTGDLLQLRLVEFLGAALRGELENGELVELRFADLASLVRPAAGVFLSDLEPALVREAGYDGPVLYPFQRDLAATGTALMAGGRSYGKGLGVHTRSRLEFTVPPGAAFFWTRVALDDSAAALPLRPEAAVRILLDDQVLFAKPDLGLGKQPADPGLLPVRPGARLVLEADFGRGRNLGDRVNWLLPVFLPPRDVR